MAETFDLHGREPSNCGKICKACKLVIPARGPDPCIGLLPGVKFACCGHGVGRGYIYFTNGTIIRFDSVTKVQYKDEFNEEELGVLFETYKNFVRE